MNPPSSIFYIALSSLIFAAAPLRAQVEISDSFDYGSGISGRETITTGTGINGNDVLVGNETWSTSGAGITPSFNGAPGAGNGALDISSSGTISRADLDVDFSPGSITATIDFSFTGFGDSGSKGLFFGFDSASRDDNLMTNASTDTAWLRIRPDQIVFRRQVDGTQGNDINSAITFTPDSSGVMSGTAILEYNIATNITTATVTGGSSVYSYTWDLLGKTPDFGAVAINTIRGEDVLIHNFEVNSIPESSNFALAISLFAAGFLLSSRRR
ncbi:hypothetical protein ACWPKS_02180 [Coraliomargarita sp. W4R72]